MELQDQPIEIVADEAELPFILARHWLLLFPIDPRARLLYELLAMHVNVTRGDNTVSATKDTLAEMMGYKKGDSLDPWLKALYGAGLASVEKKRTAGGLRDRNTYTVRLRPPRGYQGPLTLGDWYRLRKESPAQPVTPSSGVRTNRTNNVSAGGAVPPSSGVRTPVERGPVPPSSGVELDALELDVKLSSSSVVRTGEEEEKISEENHNPKTPQPARTIDPLSDDTLLVETVQTPDDEPETAASPAQSIAASLDWGTWGNPTHEQLSTLHKPLQRALDTGWPTAELRHYCNRAIAKATTSPGRYLIGALGPDHLPSPPTAHAYTHTMSPNADWRNLPDLNPDTAETKIREIKAELAARGHIRPPLPTSEKTAV